MNNTFFLFYLRPPPSPAKKASEPSMSFKIAKQEIVPLFLCSRKGLFRTGLAVREEFGKGKVLIKRTWISLVVPFKDDK